MVSKKYRKTGKRLMERIIELINKQRFIKRMKLLDEPCRVTKSK